MSDTPGSDAAADVRPRPAAAVILARAAKPPGGIELYMTRRSPHSPFAPGAFVFPGGAVDAALDGAPAIQERTLGLEAARVGREFARADVPAALPSDEPPTGAATAAALLVAGLRELFEEAGIAIARSADGTPIDAGRARSPGIDAERDLMRRGDLTFADFLQRHDWFADAAALTLFSRWITPRSEARRYDAHFFFAAAPPGQTGSADAFETHDGLWIAPADALARHRAGAFHLVYPTIKHLERFVALDSLEAAHAFARSKPVLAILPSTASDGSFAMPAPLENAW